MSTTTRRNDASSLRQPRRVLTFAQWCLQNGFSTRTGRRLIEAGKGPKITQLSERRIGVREDHAAEWQESRVR
jgi:hypothetical protein